MVLGLYYCGRAGIHTTTRAHTARRAWPGAWPRPSSPRITGDARETREETHTRVASSGLQPAHTARRHPIHYRAGGRARPVLGPHSRRRTHTLVAMPQRHTYPDPHVASCRRSSQGGDGVGRQLASRQREGPQGTRRNTVITGKEERRPGQSARARRVRMLHARAARELSSAPGHA